MMSPETVGCFTGDACKDVSCGAVPETRLGEPVLKAVLVPEALDIPAVFLARAPGRRQLGGLHGLALPGQVFALFYAVVGFVVQLLRFWCAPAPVTDVVHHHNFFLPAQAQGDPGAGFHNLAGLGALAVVVHLAALNGFLCQRAGFVEARGPEPLVEPYFRVFGVCCCHISPPGRPGCPDLWITVRIITGLSLRWQWRAGLQRWQDLVEVTDARYFRVPGRRGLGAVRCQDREALADTGIPGTFQYREAVVHHQGALLAVGNPPGQVTPERPVFLGFAQFMAGYDGIHVAVQSGAAEFQCQGVRVAVGNDHRVQAGLAQGGQKIRHVGTVADAVTEDRKSV